MANEIKAFAIETPNNKKRKLPVQDFSISKEDCKEISVEDGDAKIVKVIEHYSNVYLSTTKLEIERVTSWGAQIREKEKRIRQLESEIEKVKKQKKQVTKVVILIVTLFVCIIGLFIFGNNVHNLKHKIDEQSDVISEKQSKLDAEISKRKELQLENSNYIAEINNIKSYPYLNGSNERRENPSSDNGWVEWIVAKSPVKIRSFYTIPSSTGDITISAYNTSHERIASSTVSIKSTGWQKIILSDFLIDTPGKFYICLENTSIKLAYHSSNSSEYDLYKHGPLQLIGATSKADADKDGTSVGTGYYQYFYSIEYSLL